MREPPVRGDVPDREGVIAREPALALAGLLDVPLPHVTDGLPMLWHWAQLLDYPEQSSLGDDGHPSHGALPTTGGPGRRRMWAGGRVQYLDALRFGLPAARRSRVIRTREKAGRSGSLTFVTVGHWILQEGRVKVVESQEIVYRDTDGTSGAGADPDLAEEPTGAHWRINTTPVLLFRFSAITYNSHRIHYDRTYATEVEGYPDLVVHGPLQALAMAEAARAHGMSAWGPTSFTYRLTAPLYAGQGLVVTVTESAPGLDTTVTDDSGRITARGVMRREPSDH